MPSFAGLLSRPTGTFSKYPEQGFHKLDDDDDDDDLHQVKMFLPQPVGGWIRYVEVGLVGWSSVYLHDSRYDDDDDDDDDDDGDDLYMIGAVCISVSL